MSIPTNPHAFKVQAPRELLMASRSLVEVCMADGDHLTSFQVETIAEYLFSNGNGGSPSINHAKAQVRFWAKQEYSKRKA